MWFDPGLAGLFITSTLLHLGEDINSWVTMLSVIVHVGQQLKNEEETSLASLKKSFEKSFQIVRLKLANRFVRREIHLGQN
jgi:hypothetical protein